jgi:hypothetical protein
LDYIDNILKIAESKEMGHKDIKHGIQERAEVVERDGIRYMVTTQYTINPMDTAELPDGMMSANIVSQTEERLDD